MLVRQGENNFNAIRIAMALLVVWSHSFALYFGSERAEPISFLTSGVFNAGNLAVLVFFMVSGFLITQSFERSSSPWSYLKKRVARIHPGYLVAMGLCAFVLVPLYAGSRYSLGSVGKTIVLNLLLQGYSANGAPFVHNPSHTLNGSLWSIPYEFWCYLGVLAIGVGGLLKANRRILLLTFTIILMLLHSWVEFSGKQPGWHLIGAIIGWPYEWFIVLPCFLAGSLTYLYRDLIPRRGAWVLFGVLLLVGSSHLPVTMHDRAAINAILFPLVISYTTFYIAFSEHTWEGARYGDFSYGTYLYAFPIQQLLLAGLNLPFADFVASSMALSLFAGILSWYGVERWFHQSARINSLSTSSPGLRTAA